jgi:hypothetical protein
LAFASTVIDEFYFFIFVYCYFVVVSVYQYILLLGGNFSKFGFVGLVVAVVFESTRNGDSKYMSLYACILIFCCVV